MKSIWKKYLLYSIYIIVGGGLLYGLLQMILVGYSAPWTGFGERTLSNGDLVGEKTLWDWMELLIIPLVLALGAFFLNRSERGTERETAKDRLQEAALQAYMGRMSELLLKEKLRTTRRKEVRDVARTLTISVIRGLDKERKNLVIQFLREAKLITDKNSILNGADMEGMDLRSLNLRGVFLQNSNLAKADLRYTDLEDANFKDSTLEEANLQVTFPVKDAWDKIRSEWMGFFITSNTMYRFRYKTLDNINLQGANLKGANIGGARLLDANLQRTELSKANLQWAFLANAKLQEARLWQANLKGANFENVVLQKASLWEANLQGANLIGADLREAELPLANLARAWLSSANLQNANLTNAVLKDAKLNNVNLQGAKVTPEQLAQAKSLKGATMPDGTIHE